MRLILFGGVISPIATHMFLTYKGVRIINLIADTESALYEDDSANVIRLEGFLCF